MAYKLSKQSWMQMKADSMEMYNLPRIQNSKQPTVNQLKSQIESN